MRRFASNSRSRSASVGGGGDLGMSITHMRAQLTFKFCLSFSCTLRAADPLPSLRPFFLHRLV